MCKFEVHICTKSIKHNREKCLKAFFPSFYLKMTLMTIIIGVLQMWSDRYTMIWTEKKYNKALLSV